MAKRDVGNDPVRGLALYRSNFRPGSFRPGSFRIHNLRGPGKRGVPARVTIPVHVVVPLKDPFVAPALAEGLESWVDDVTVTRVDAGHWWPATRPADFAALLRRTGTTLGTTPRAAATPPRTTAGIAS
jgi:hypothetical protein